MGCTLTPSLASTPYARAISSAETPWVSDPSASELVTSLCVPSVTRLSIPSRWAYSRPVRMPIIFRTRAAAVLIERSRAVRKLINPRKRGL